MRKSGHELAAARRWTEADARLLMREWKRSGLRLWTFARERGITPQRLAWWHQRLERRARPTSKVSLVPARVVASTGSDAAVGVVVQLPNGIAIDLGGASASFVASLVRDLLGAA